MKSVAIAGGGVAGLSAGILLQQAGYQTDIFEKNAQAGGLCTGWRRQGCVIDNCLHWLTGTRPGSGLHELWRTLGVLGDDVRLFEKPSLLTAHLGGETLTLWRDPERTRRDMLALSPQDAAEINSLIDHVKLAESMSIPVEKPMDAMGPLDYARMAASMKDMGRVMARYGNMSLEELAARFHHPLIRSAILDYMPPGYLAYAFVVSYATITGGNGDLPLGGSLEVARRLEDRYTTLGGRLHTNAPVARVILGHKRADAIRLQDGTEATADYYVLAMDPDYIFSHLLNAHCMPRSLRIQYQSRSKYPVSSSFQAAFVCDGQFDELSGTHIFSCRNLNVAGRDFSRLSLHSYDYAPEYAPPGKLVLQSNLIQSERECAHWRSLSQDTYAYREEKARIAASVQNNLEEAWPQLRGRLTLLDAWTPATYMRWTNAYNGAYMAFVAAKGAKNRVVPGKVRGLKNVFLASQWLMSPGGLPTAAVMGKHAAWRILRAR